MLSRKVANSRKLVDGGGQEVSRSNFYKYETYVGVGVARLTLKDSKSQYGQVITGTGCWNRGYSRVTEPIRIKTLFVWKLLTWKCSAKLHLEMITEMLNSTSYESTFAPFFV